MYIVTNTDQRINLGLDYQNQTCDLQALGTDIYYVASPDSTDQIRTAKTAIITTDVEAVDGKPTQFDYEVADSTVFRVGDVLRLFLTGGTTRVGSVKVVSAPDATTIRIQVLKTITDDEPAAGDVLEIKPDTRLPDGNSLQINTRSLQTMLVKASAANSSNNLIVTRLDSDVLKKN